MTEECCLLSSFLLFDIVGFSILLGFPTLEDYFIRKPLEELLGKKISRVFVLSSNSIFLIAISLLYIVSSLFIMASMAGLPFYSTYWKYGAYMTVGATVATPIAVIGYFYAAHIIYLTTKIQRGEI